jgi:hypothetical protein
VAAFIGTPPKQFYAHALVSATDRPQPCCKAMLAMLGSAWISMGAIRKCFGMGSVEAAPTYWGVGEGRGHALNCEAEPDIVSTTSLIEG